MALIRDEIHDILDKYPEQLHNILRHNNSSTLPTAEQQQQLPLHSFKLLDVIDVEKLRSILSTQHRERFDFCWRLISRPPLPPDRVVGTTAARKSPLLKKHVDRLIEDGIVARVSSQDLLQRPTKSFGIAFTVVEEREGKSRQRMIFWPKEINEILTPDVYKAEMRLPHVSRLVPAVTDEAAVVGDLKIAFYQHQLDATARQFYRFQIINDTDPDAVYEMCRMCMGSRPACEVQQLTTEAIAGCLHAAIPRFANLHTTNNVVVDGIRLAGSRAHCRAAIDRVNAAAQLVGATFKEPPAIVTNYTFNGVDFDHENKRIAVAAKTKNKIPHQLPATCTAGDLESMCARLIFASGALLIPLAQHYFVIKWVTRLASQLRSGSKNVHATINISDLTRKRINAWLQQVHQPLDFSASKHRSNQQSSHDILYTDASAYGWGAFLLLANGEIAISGSKWPSDTTLSESNINNLEAIAVASAFETFADRLQHRKNVEFRIDNTSVLAAMGRALAGTFTINNLLARTLQRLRDDGYRYTVTFVKSENNFADEPSRNLQTRAGVPDTHLSGGSTVGRVAR
jgi:hypothetical protein